MIIRKAKVEDSESITSLLMLATGEVMYRFIGESNYSKAYDFLRHFVESENNQYSFQNCYVIEDGGEIQGALLAYDGAKLHELREPVMEYIHQHFDPNLIVEEETQAGEYYIDSIGVLPTQQGKGIGATLLNYVIREQVFENGRTLGLLVDKTNPRAKRLYQKLGFESVGEKNLMGISLEHLQLKGSIGNKSMAI
ncbi:MAG TPA: GNAT family N-acetyltransferase [Algoriphagus sp.]|nr:GNAT family N-acetyltransferase [Algoriphagus sp.]